MRRSHNFTAVIEREDEQYVALCPELDIAVREQAQKMRAPIYVKRQNFFMNMPLSRKLLNGFTLKCLLPGLRQQLRKLRILSGTELYKILEENGFERVKQTGSHIIMQKNWLQQQNNSRLKPSRSAFWKIKINYSTIRNAKEYFSYGINRP